eukprot:25217-Pelagococcus_subviridis.AAC.3
MIRASRPRDRDCSWDVSGRRAARDFIARRAPDARATPLHAARAKNARPSRSPSRRRGRRGRPRRGERAPADGSESVRPAGLSRGWSRARDATFALRAPPARRACCR